MEEPLFSIITITFNAEKELPPTLDSVSRQTFHDFEYLIIDGKSGDNTVKIAQGSGIRMTIISEPDKGLYDAMNKGMRKAKGKYLIFLNAGDAFHSPETLSEIATTAEANGYPDIVYGQTQLVNSSHEFVGMRHLSAPKHLTFKSFSRGMLVCHQAFVAKREIAEPYNLRYRFSADYDWCIRIMRTAARRKLPMKNAGIIVADYLDGGMTTQNHRRSLMERFRVMAHHYGIITAAAMHLWFVARAVVKK